MVIAIWGVSPVFGDQILENTTDGVTEDFDNIKGYEYLTRPTFGLSHENHERIVENGFKFNNQTFSISDNFHTPFTAQSVIIGKVNTFEAITFSETGLRVQEFLFGIPNIGEAHLAELGIEVWYDTKGEIEKFLTVQNSEVIDKNSIIVTGEKIKCQNSDTEEKCKATKITMKFLEPLKDNVMAIKAIDYKNRYQITYLNEGFEILGDSLNPMPIKMIPSPVKGEGLIEVKQTEKYSDHWTASDDRIFEMNRFGSFKQINQSFKRFQDSGDPLTRYHSGFSNVVEKEKERATNVFNSTALASKIPESYTYQFSISDRISDEVKLIMIEQEQIAQKFLENTQVQYRYSNHSPLFNPLTGERIQTPTSNEYKTQQVMKTKYFSEDFTLD